ncbi:MAG: DUF975 family protein [Clostridia bacterium]|nr:DUF975 family protein [Clostridia bacterium]
MSISSEAVKKTAKTVLKEKWFSSAVYCLCLVVIFFLFQYIGSALSTIIGKIGYFIFNVLWLIFLFSPLVLGALKHFWRMLFGVEDDFVSLFYYFSSKKEYIKALKFILNLSFRFLVCGFVFYTPALIANFFSGTAFYSRFNIHMPMWVSNLWLVSSVLEFIAFVAIVILSLKYYIAPVLFVADEDMDPSEAVHMSAIISKGSNSDFIYLLFSLIGWILLCLFIIPMPAILPYIFCCYLIHCRFSVAKYNKYASDLKMQNGAFEERL